MKDSLKRDFIVLAALLCGAAAASAEPAYADACPEWQIRSWAGRPFVFLNYLAAGGRLLLTHAQAERLGDRLVALKRAGRVELFGLAKAKIPPHIDVERWYTPPHWGASATTLAARKQGVELLPYEQRFVAEVARVMKGLRDEYVPVRVTGAVEFTVNWRPTGWLIGLINNEGVTKGNTTPVKDNRVSLDIAPGEVRIIELRERQLQGLSHEADPQHLRRQLLGSPATVRAATCHKGETTMKHVLTLLAAFLLAPLAALHAAEEPPVLPVWPAGKMPGAGAAAPESEAPARGDGVIRVTNVSEPTLTVFRAPAATAPTPAVIICPGGAYQILAMNKEGTEIAAWLNTLGVTGIVLKYRVPKNMEGALQDLQRAVRLVRARQQEWNIDVTRVGVMGFSAGGNLCARLSTTHGTASYPPLDDVDRSDDRPAFTVLVYPAYLGAGGRVAQNLKVSGKAPPSFIAQSEDDKSFVAGTKLYVEALTAAKVPHEFALFPTGGHGYGLRCTQDAKAWPDRCAAWLKTIRVLP